MEESRSETRDDVSTPERRERLGGQLQGQRKLARVSRRQSGGASRRRRGEISVDTRDDVSTQGQMERASDAHESERDNLSPNPSPPLDDWSEDNSFEGDVLGLSNFDLDSMECIVPWSEGCLKEIEEAFPTDHSSWARVNFYGLEADRVTKLTKVFKGKFRGLPAIHLGLLHSFYTIYFIGPFNLKGVEERVAEAWFEVKRRSLKSTDFFARGNLRDVKDLLLPVDKAMELFKQLISRLGERATNEGFMYMRTLGVKAFFKYERLEDIRLPDIWSNLKRIEGASMRVDVAEEVIAAEGKHIHLTRSGAESLRRVDVYPILGHQAFVNVSRKGTDDLIGLNIYSLSERIMLGLNIRASFSDLISLRRRILEANTVGERILAVNELGEAFKKTLLTIKEGMTKDGAMRMEVSIMLCQSTNFKQKLEEIWDDELVVVKENIQSWTTEDKTERIDNILEQYLANLNAVVRDLPNYEGDAKMQRKITSAAIILEGFSLLHYLTRGSKRNEIQTTWDLAFKETAFEVDDAFQKAKEMFEIWDETVVFRELHVEKFEASLVAVRTSRLSLESLISSCVNLMWTYYWNKVQTQTVRTPNFCASFGLSSETEEVLMMKRGNTTLGEFIQQIQQIGDEIWDNETDVECYAAERMDARKYALRLAVLFQAKATLKNAIEPKLEMIEQLEDVTNKWEVVAELTVKMQSGIFYFPPLTDDGNFERQHLEPTMIEWEEEEEEGSETDEEGDSEEGDSGEVLGGGGQNLEEENTGGEVESHADDDGDDGDDEEEDEEDEDEEDEEDEDEEEDDNHQLFPSMDQDFHPFERDPVERDPQRNQLVALNTERNQLSEIEDILGSPAAKDDKYLIGILEERYIRDALQALQSQVREVSAVDEASFFPASFRGDRNDKRRLDFIKQKTKQIKKIESQINTSVKKTFEAVESAFLIISCLSFMRGRYPASIQSPILAAKLDGTYGLNYARTRRTLSCHTELLVKTCSILGLKLEGEELKVDTTLWDRLELNSIIYLKPKHFQTRCQVDLTKIIDLMKEAVESENGVMTTRQREAYVKFAKTRFKEGDKHEAPLKDLLCFCFKEKEKNENENSRLLEFELQQRVKENKRKEEKRKEEESNRKEESKRKEEESKMDEEEKKLKEEKMKRQKEKLKGKRKKNISKMLSGKKRKVSQLFTQIPKKKKGKTIQHLGDLTKEQKKDSAMIQKLKELKSKKKEEKRDGQEEKTKKVDKNM